LVEVGGGGGGRESMSPDKKGSFTKLDPSDCGNRAAGSTIKGVGKKSKSQEQIESEDVLVIREHRGEAYRRNTQTIKS